MDEIRPVRSKIQELTRVAARMGGVKRSRLARSPASSCATIVSRRTIGATTRLTRDFEIGSDVLSTGARGSALRGSSNPFTFRAGWCQDL